jgi:hypothetical protein
VSVVLLPPYTLLTRLQPHTYSDLSLSLLPSGTSLFRHGRRYRQIRRLGTSQYMLLSAIDYLALRYELHQELRYRTASSNQCLWRRHCDIG